VLCLSLFSFFVFLFFVPKVASVSGLSIFDYPFGFP
jgi:hypothetical protein